MNKKDKNNQQEPKEVNNKEECLREAYVFDTSEQDNTDLKADLNIRRNRWNSILKNVKQRETIINEIFNPTEIKHYITVEINTKKENDQIIYDIKFTHIKKMQ